MQEGNQTAWTILSDGTIDHPNPQHGQIREKTEFMMVPHIGKLFRTTVFRKDGSVVSTSLATLP